MEGWFLVVFEIKIPSWLFSHIYFMEVWLYKWRKLFRLKGPCQSYWHTVMYRKSCKLLYLTAIYEYRNIFSSPAPSCCCSTADGPCVAFCAPARCWWSYDTFHIYCRGILCCNCGCSTVVWFSIPWERYSRWPSQLCPTLEDCCSDDFELMPPIFLIE